MRKLIAIVNVVAWPGFWAFGYLALTAEGFSQIQIAMASGLAFAGVIVGGACYLTLACAAKADGYAAKSNILDAGAHQRAQSNTNIQGSV